MSYDDYKLTESPSMSAEQLDEQMEAEQAAKLEDLRQVAEDFCDYVNNQSYFGGWAAEIAEHHVIIFCEPAGEKATHDFDLIEGGAICIHRGARGLNWFSEGLLACVSDYEKSRAEMEAKKAAMKGGAK